MQERVWFIFELSMYLIKIAEYSHGGHSHEMLH